MEPNRQQKSLTKEPGRQTKSPTKMRRELQVLRLVQAPLTDAMLLGISHALHGQLRELDLSFCIQITDSSMNHVLQKQERLGLLKVDGCDQVRRS